MYFTPRSLKRAGSVVLQLGISVFDTSYEIGTTFYFSGNSGAG